MISDLTYQVVAHTAVRFKSDLFIDWAIEMIGLGYESDSLFMLASFSKPVSRDEVVDYVNDAITELGLELKEGDAGIISYGSYFIHRIAAGANIREHVDRIYSGYIMNDFNIAPLYDFYLLYNAWVDIDEKKPHINYWDNVNASNIEQEVIRVAKEWIEMNREHYEIVLRQK